MAKKTQIDWVVLQEQRSAGASVAELARMYGVSKPSIYLHTAGNGKLKSSKVPAAAVEINSRAEAKNKNFATVYGKTSRSEKLEGALEVVIAERDKLDGVIAGLQALLGL